MTRRFHSLVRVSPTSKRYTTTVVGSFGMEEERQRRIGRNQALFREVNERIERVSGALRTGTDTITVLCECGNQSCAEHIEVSLSDYERVRAEPTLFLVRPGHA